MIEVNFQHFKYTFSQEDLINGSPNKRKDIAKAFTPQPDSYLDNKFKIPKKELGECLLNAIHHLAIDPHVRMWYSFTEIQQVVPTMRFSVKFFELEVSDERRITSHYSIPSPVVDGLAERAIQVAIANSEIEFDAFKNKNKSNKRKKSENQLTKTAREQIDYVMKTLSLDKDEELIEKIWKSIQQQIENFKTIDSQNSESDINNNQLLLDSKISFNQLLLDSKISFNDDDIKFDVEEGLKSIRNIGDKCLYQIKFSPIQRTNNIAKDWQDNFKKTNESYATIDYHHFWCCGSSIFFLCKEEEKEELYKKIKKQIK